MCQMLDIKLLRATSKPSEHSLMFCLVFVPSLAVSSQGSWCWRMLDAVYVIFNVPSYFFRESTNRVLLNWFIKTDKTDFWNAKTTAPPISHQQLLQICHITFENTFMMHDSKETIIKDKTIWTTEVVLERHQLNPPAKNRQQSTHWNS